MAHLHAKAVSAGVAALARMQLPDGSFAFFTGSPATGWRPCGRLFSTAYIMLGSGRLLPPANIARAVAFIRTQRRPDGLWEYDPALRIPPDSDSTACSLAALALHGDLSDLANGADLLRSYWRSDGGPFRSWKAAGMWSLPERDDAVVNCNILFALRLLGASATPDEDAAVHRLLRRSASSRYYCAPATIAHAARRAGLDREALSSAAAARPPPQDLLGSAQWLCGTREPDTERIAALLAAQHPAGYWPFWPWVTGQGTPQPFWGSAAISTGLAVEALDQALRPANTTSF
jgi:hypothetical protein